MNILGPTAGVWMLLLLGILTITTGLPVWALLIGVSSAFACLGVFAGLMDMNILSAMSSRLVGLLESDLLQALPLYVFVGVLLQRLAVADAVFSSMLRWFRPLGGSYSLATLGLGTLIAPMNGSVASSSALITRLIAPRLGVMDPAHATALISVAATIGVVVPPSLVLILLGDAMMRAHTEASNLPGFLLGQQRIINTQDVFNAALIPSLCVLLLWALVARWQSRHFKPSTPVVSRRQYGVAVVSSGVIVLLLAGIFAGKLFAVEAAATGCMLLLIAALLSRSIQWPQWKDLLGETLNLSGALMALLVGATVFSLVFRLFGTDRWLLQTLMSSSMSPLMTAVTVLIAVGLCAWVLDAFEMIFVVLPIVAPPLIVMLEDAQQVSVLLLLVLQLSFVMPPIGYAVMMARSRVGMALSISRVLAALIPFILAQLCVVTVVFAAPWLVHQLDAPVVQTPEDSEQEIVRKMQEMSKASIDTAEPDNSAFGDQKR